ncbi:hypothetical protein DYU11_05175 [Fibrisoma montanum]|uniref:Lipoprotein n=1 Tax=Fibrisoma montanum TaxID=2305895 RepID=A0A418MJY6_9BACT|nr:hypothetical protein [Fibrisoma montanum]RIV27696.1 hypothetical protein DYU11_05175 [Fibrisoma montanum]
MKAINRIAAFFLTALVFTACTGNDIKPAKAVLTDTSVRSDTLVEPTRTIDGFEPTTDQPVRPTSENPARGKHQPAATDGAAPDVLSRPADVTAF